MKRYLIISLLIVCCCFSVINMQTLDVYAYQLFEQKIVVKGVGEVFAEPDMATISLGVETLNKDIVSAESENAKVVNNLFDILSSNNIPKKDIKTTNYSIYKKHDYNKRQDFLGYQVVNKFNVNIYQLQNIGTIISQLTRGGANIFSGVTFSVINKENLQAQALEKALQSAKNKAKVLVGENITITKIAEENIYNAFPVRSDMAIAFEKSSSIISGECKVTASIMVEFKAI